MSALALTLALTLGAQAKITKVAVLDVQDTSGNQANEARLLTQIITGEASRDARLQVISSAQIRQMLGVARQKKLLGCGDEGCMAEIGGALGADFLLTASLGKIGKRYRLDLTLIDQARTRTAAVAGGFLPTQEDALADATVRMVNEVLVKAGLRTPAVAALGTAGLAEDAAISHTSAYLAYGIAAVFAAGAGVMTALTHSTYRDAVRDYQEGQPSPSASGQKLEWMGPLTDSLWAGALIAAGTGTVLYFTASPAGSGGEIGLRGSF